MSNLVIVPWEIVSYIAEFCDCKSQCALGLTHRKMKRAVDEAFYGLAIGQTSKPVSGLPPLIDLFKRFPNIRSLSIAGLPAEKVVDTAQLLMSTHNHYPATLRRLNLIGLYANHRVEFAPLVHPQTEELLVDFTCSNDTNRSINELLRKTVQLKSLSLRSHRFVLSLHLSHCKHLARLTLSGALHTGTIEHLSHCSNITELRLELDIRWQGSDEALRLLQSDFGLQLHILKLGEGFIAGDDEDLNKLTQKLTNLKVLSIESLRGGSGISDRGFLQLADNCPNLKELRRLDIKRVTDQGLAQFGAKLPQLERLQIRMAYQITDVGIKALAERCPSLTFLDLVHCKDITDVSLLALERNCKNFRFFGFSCCGGALKIQDLITFAESCTTLQELVICLQPINSSSFYRQFPRLKKHYRKAWDGDYEL